MGNGFQTEAASKTFDSIKHTAHAFLSDVNEQRFGQIAFRIDSIRSAIVIAKEKGKSVDESYLSDIYVLGAYVEFLSAYSVLWEKIIQQRFSDSWTSLQDAMDLLRVIKRFSTVDVSFFEDQLTELEQLYPYKIFCSIGITVDRFECSLCGEDIDSTYCPHMRGNLYGGRMAQAIAKNATSIDHIALVTNPEDKRCVVSYEDSAEQFKLIRYLSSLILSGQCSPLDFSHLRHSKRRIANPSYVRLGRNDCCYCGSGKKFKKCCVSKEFIENDHVDIIASRNALKLLEKTNTQSE